jgi:hypothetical protein
MLQVDDVIEPGAEQILLSRLPPFPWLHLVPRRSIQRAVNHKSNLQGIPLPHSRQTQLPSATFSRFQNNDLGILHGRLENRASGVLSRVQARFRFFAMAAADMSDRQELHALPSASPPLTPLFSPKEHK